MKTEKLIIGRIPYANLFPLFYYLDRECDNSAYKFIRGVPSKLNKMLRHGEIDITPSSSIEYLRNRNKYLILPWFSISSYGPINSILLFSKFPLNELGGKTIAVSSESETSTALLRIILREFLFLKSGFRPTNRRSVKNILSSSPAVLLIGDTAMIEAKKAAAVSGVRVADRIPNPGLRNPDSSLFIYDLGELWYEFTGLPFVYALWVVRKKSLSQKSELIRKLSHDLINAKKYAVKRFPLIAGEAPQKEWISRKELVDYWKIISYDFTGKHLDGLKLFEKYALKRRG